MTSATFTLFPMTWCNARSVVLACAASKVNAVIVERMLLNKATIEKTAPMVHHFL